MLSLFSLSVFGDTYFIVETVLFRFIDYLGLYAKDVLVKLLLNLFLEL